MYGNRTALNFNKTINANKKSAHIFYARFGNKFLKKRRVRDSNPRNSFPFTRFPSVLLQPLGQLSVFKVDGKCTCLDLYKEINLISFPFACF